MSLTLSDFFNTRTEQETLEPVVLYEGATIGSTQSVPLLYPLSDFEDVEIHCDYTYGGARYALTVTRLPTTTLLDTNLISVSFADYYESSSMRTSVGTIPSRNTETLLYVSAFKGSSITTTGVYKVIGYRRRISAVGIDELMSAMSLPNLCANADLSINQRGFDGNWAGLAIGAYGYDQWVKVSDTHMAYVIEEGFYKPNSKYTVTKDDAVAGEFISPDSGHFAVSVPFATSGKYDIYMGQFKRPWHPVQDGLERCQRHYLLLHEVMESGSVYASGYAGVSGATFPCSMRKIGTVQFTTLSSVPSGGWSEMTQRVYLTTVGFSRIVKNTGLSVGAGLYLRSKITVDATITLAELAVYDVISKQWVKEPKQSLQVSAYYTAVIPYTGGTSDIM